jgi:SAM-dependent methyltransferase
MDHATSAANKAARIDAGRRYARQLAAESIAHGDATGWFEPLYAAAEQGATTVPWADLAPYPGLASELAGLPGRGRALVVGCGLGDDAEHVATLGFTTVAFDVSPTAIATAQRRFPGSAVEYVAADLLSPPQGWAGAFDLVVEVFTLQVLTGGAAYRLRPTRPAARARRPAASDRAGARRAREPRPDAMAAHSSRGRIIPRIRAGYAIHRGCPRRRRRAGPPLASMADRSPFRLMSVQF